MTSNVNAPRTEEQIIQAMRRREGKRRDSLAVTDTAADVFASGAAKGMGDAEFGDVFGHKTQNPLFTAEIAATQKAEKNLAPDATDAALMGQELGTIFKARGARRNSMLGGMKPNRRKSLLGPVETSGTGSYKP